MIPRRSNTVQPAGDRSLRSRSASPAARWWRRRRGAVGSETRTSCRDLVVLANQAPETPQRRSRPSANNVINRVAALGGSGAGGCGVGVGASQGGVQDGILGFFHGGDGEGDCIDGVVLGVLSAPFGALGVALGLPLLDLNAAWRSRGRSSGPGSRSTGRRRPGPRQRTCHATGSRAARRWCGPGRLEWPAPSGSRPEPRPRHPRRPWHAGRARPAARTSEP
jgi:hypothetical protein